MNFYGSDYAFCRDGVFLIARLFATRNGNGSEKVYYVTREGHFIWEHSGSALGQDRLLLKIDSVVE